MTRSTSLRDRLLGMTGRRSSFRARAACRGAAIVLAASCLPVGLASTAIPAGSDDARDTAASTPSAEPEVDAPREWPAELEAEGYDVVVHAPQVESWRDYREVRFRVAVAVTARSDAALKALPEPAYGVLRLRADTAADVPAGVVEVSGCSLEDILLDPLVPALIEPLSVAVGELFPLQARRTLPIELILNAMEQPDAAVREVEVGLAPPRIYYADRPALLVNIAGEPDWQPVPGGGMTYASNTNWDLLRDASGTFLLRSGSGWLASGVLRTGTWLPVDELPQDLFRLPTTPDWFDVRDSVPGVRSLPSLVFVSTEPAELIVTDGPPDVQHIEGTGEPGVSWVANADGTLLYDNEGEAYYFLVAGRWFSASSLDGPWQAATGRTPPAFARIPESHPSASALASIPGTPMARDAVVMATIPRQATFRRDELSLEVEYDGRPVFLPVPGTSIEAAVNSPFTVLKVDDAYYCCESAVWFRSASPEGPWAVADSVPPSVYEIPPASPLHNVTYVTVADSDAETVTAQHTAGYTGAYLSTGLVLLGAGAITYAMFANADNVNWNVRVNAGPIDIHYRSSPITYGCGARYDPATGVFRRAAPVHYGPYGGAGRWATWNPETGRMSRGAAAWGPSGTFAAREAYNPTTGVASARVSAATPYGRWSRGVASDGDRAVAGGRATGRRGSVGGARTSEGGAGVAGDRRGGGAGFAARTSGGDLYAGKDGKVYRRDGQGEWSQVGGRPNAAGASAVPKDVRTDLQRQSESRSRAARQAQQRGGLNAGRGGSIRGGRGGGGRGR
ncbi:MAG: hypothetical protein KDA22_09860 [Phycisphaerales bacterium]|nr:hypothetical protein [Phycisphaerales bacterium]